MSPDGRIAVDNRRSEGHRTEWEERERQLVLVARRQHDVVEIGQLYALGFSEAGVRRRTRAGRLYRKHLGVYALGRPDLSMKGHWMAAVLACGEGAVLSHRSCAGLRGLLRPGDGRIEVTIPKRSRRSVRGLRIHRSQDLTPADLDLIDGIPCTSVARTLLDLATVVPPRVLESACNQAEIERSLDMRSARELLDRRHGQPGTARLRSALSMPGLGTDRTRSELERRFLAIVKRAGLPMPAINQWMAIAGEEWQCDFVWHRERVAVEVDGWETHRTPWAFRADRRRDRLLQAHGWRALRFVWDEVAGEPATVAATTAAALMDSGNFAEPPGPGPSSRR